MFREFESHPLRLLFSPARIDLYDHAYPVHLYAGIGGILRDLLIRLKQVSLFPNKSFDAVILNEVNEVKNLYGTISYMRFFPFIIFRVRMTSNVIC